MRIVVFVFLLYSIATGLDFSVFHPDVFALIDLVFILNVGLNKKSLINLENKYLTYLGRISYGLFIYHPIFIVLSIKFLKNNFSLNNTLFNTLLYLLIMSGSIAISMLSNRFFERPFIQLKKSFSIVKTKGFNQN